MMDTGVPPPHGCHNSHSSLSQVPIVEDKAKGEVFVSCKRKQNNNYLLPREVIFNILLLIPAKVLQEVVRYVCKQWYDIVIDPVFVRAHFQMTASNSASFIIQSHYKRYKMYCADEDGAQSVKLTKIKLPFPAKVQGSCNGLVLFTDNRESQKVYLMNPLRKLVVSLPPPVVPMVLRKAYCTLYSLAITSSGQFKMVHISLYDSPNRCEMSVFTIGVDKAWRTIDLRHLRGIFLDPHYSWKGGLVIEGFVYWYGRSYLSLVMDVDTETLYLTSMPKGALSYGWESYFISMGTALGIMAEVDNERGIWKLLRLTDVKSSEWTEIGMINIGGIVTKVSNGKWTYDSLSTKPVSLIGKELCFLYGVSMTSSSMIRYNLANKSFVSFRVNTSCRFASYFHHAPTLVSLKT